MWRKNAITWCLALVYGGMCGSVLFFSGCIGWSWSLKLVRGGTCGYLWEHIGVNGYLLVRVAWE
jgi:hypothetical protein